MVLMWTAGDLFKTAYFLMNRSPVQFWFCSLVQIIIDVAVLLQVLLYSRDTRVKLCWTVATQCFSQRNNGISWKCIKNKNKTKARQSAHYNEWIIWIEPNQGNKLLKTSATCMLLLISVNFKHCTLFVCVVLYSTVLWCRKVWWCGNTERETLLILAAPQPVCVHWNPRRLIYCLSDDFPTFYSFSLYVVW